jgi:hypothetical protein
MQRIIMGMGVRRRMFRGGDTRDWANRLGLPISCLRGVNFRMRGYWAGCAVGTFQFAV